MKTTKVQVLKNFREFFADALKEMKNDVVAKRELWNNYTDTLLKDGEITVAQYNKWSNPF